MKVYIKDRNERKEKKESTILSIIDSNLNFFISFYAKFGKKHIEFMSWGFQIQNDLYKLARNYSTYKLCHHSAFYFLTRNLRKRGSIPETVKCILSLVTPELNYY